MADIRIKDLATTASVTASDDFMAVDGVTNGTRKLSAATPSFATSVTTPSLTSPASTNLTLGTGSFGTALTVASATGDVSIASTTAGSANAGALVVAGGGSFGNNGSASYFGGSVQIATAIISQSGNHAYITGPTTAGAFLTLQSGNATGGISFRDSAVNNVAQYYQDTDAWSFYKPTTFAGAVTIAGTVVNTLSATPASASAAGTVGTISWDANYIYICTATNTWKRVAIATW